MTPAWLSGVLAGKLAGEFLEPPAIEASVVQLDGCHVHDGRRDREGDGCCSARSEVLRAEGERAEVTAGTCAAGPGRVSMLLLKHGTIRFEDSALGVVSGKTTRSRRRG